MGKWEMVRLGDAAHFTMGQSPSSESYNSVGEGMPFFQGKSDFGLMYPTVRMFCTDPKKVAEIHDILISVRAPVGAVNIATETCCIGRGLAAISQREKLSGYKYIYYYLKYKEADIANMGVGSTFKAISKKDLDIIEIPLPPLPVQQQIADALDRASALIEKRKAQIDKLDLLAKAQFIEMFGDPVTNPMGWEVKRLGEIALVGSSKRVFVDELVASGIPFYRGTEIGAMATGETITPSLFITQDHYERLRNATGIPQIGDFLMPSICPDGRIWRVNTIEPFYFKDGRVLWVQFANKILNDSYLLYALKEKIIADYANIASGTTFAELKIFSLKSVSVLLPPLPLQNEFADFVTQIEAQKDKMRQGLDKLELNYKSLMQKCFRGEIF